ncbi:5-dehydro-4-deoxy-D-glucuronate isomerase [Agromyces silvae]|uniref:5-dehydro-4-deoxy-D-glucuronate isomerase n=1 Tax=Agromyces silvae TaxID=3388266 RepID=UPI00280BCCA8|nr:5-dehydro-4-deoxy-D-glucuronate isomerase [Agromyces protaetiae]
MHHTQERYATHPAEYLTMDSTALRERFVCPDLFREGATSLVYSHEDRMAVGGAFPVPGVPLELVAPDQFRTANFCDRRELTVMNIGTPGTVVVDGEAYELGHRDCLYIGRGHAQIEFRTATEATKFFLASATSHRDRPVELITADAAASAAAGAVDTANERTIAKYVHADGAQSDQLVLGITSLERGSVWNSMPPHLHGRRTEMYLYFGLPEDDRVFHFMGEPGQPRTISVRNEELVIAPAWSMHFGAGTSNYAFIWVMAGENQAFEDMDQVSVVEI